MTSFSSFEIHDLSVSISRYLKDISLILKYFFNGKTPLQIFVLDQNPQSSIPNTVIQGSKTSMIVDLPLFHGPLRKKKYYKLNYETICSYLLDVLFYIYVESYFRL